MRNYPSNQAQAGDHHQLAARRQPAPPSTPRFSKQLSCLLRVAASTLKIGDDFVLMRHLAATPRQKQCLRRWDVLAPM
jgi:hypothetical protein